MAIIGTAINPILVEESPPPDAMEEASTANSTPKTSDWMQEDTEGTPLLPDSPATPSPQPVTYAQIVKGKTNRTAMPANVINPNCPLSGLLRLQASSMKSQAVNQFCNVKGSPKRMVQLKRQALSPLKDSTLLKRRRLEQPLGRPIIHRTPLSPEFLRVLYRVVPGNYPEEQEVQLYLDQHYGRDAERMRNFMIQTKNKHKSVFFNY